MTGRMQADVRSEAIRTLYRQAPNSAIAALVVTVYMVATAQPYTSWPVVLGWLGAQALLQVLRLTLVAAFRRRHVQDERLPRWARAYALYMLVAGAAWGLAPFLFMHPAQPITIALTLCGLYGISGGAVPGNAYYPAGLYLFVLSIFGGVLAWMLAQRSAGYAVLGFASLAYAAIMMLFCRVQAASIADSLRIRFENVELVAALRRKTEDAEAAQAAAERASHAKSLFIAAASHDLRQPMHALGLLVGALAPSCTAPASQRILGDVRANLAALGGLFDGLLDIARLDAGAVAVKREAIAPDALFDRIDHLLSPLAAECGMDLRFRSDGARLHSDPLLIEQILLNIAGNALRHSGARAVLIAARRRGGRVRLEVWDNGRGIADADQARIFDEFVQLSNPERDRSKGMGLGLPIARRSAHLLGSDLVLRSLPGRGSLFWLEQPLTDALPRPAAMPDEEASSVPPLVLLLDDDAGVRTAVQELLTANAIPCTTCATPDEARRAMAEQRFTHVLSDFRLPGSEHGLAFLTAARAGGLLGDAQPYLVSGDMDPTLIATALEAGIPLLHKPIQPDRLLALIAGTRPLPGRAVEFDAGNLPS